MLVALALNTSRRSSGDRHNRTLHAGKAEILPILDYIAGRRSGLYLPENPLRYRRNLGMSSKTSNYGSKFDNPTPTIYNQYPQSRTFIAPLSTSNSSMPILDRRSKLVELETLAATCLGRNQAKLMVDWASIQPNDSFLDLNLTMLRSRSKYRI